MSEQQTTTEAAPAPKKRRTRATIGAAAVKLVHAVRRNNYTEGLRAAEVLALALEREGDAASASVIRAAVAGPGTLMPIRPAGSAAGEWHMPGAPLDALVLGEDLRERFEDLVVELEAAPRFIAAGIDAPTRIFFDGPSGTGKTLAAKHLAERLGVPLLLGRLDQIVDSHLGESSKKIAGLFEAAKSTPCIVFIDEIDAIVGDRTNKKSAAEMENARTTSSLLQQLDLLPPDQVVIIASNFPGELDSALARRFPIRLSFEAPGMEARCAMLRHWWRNVGISEHRIKTLANASEGRSGSDLRALAMAEARAVILDQERQR